MRFFIHWNWDIHNLSYTHTTLSSKGGVMSNFGSQSLTFHQPWQKYNVYYILILFQVSKWETTKWRPWIQRGVHPRGWWAHRGKSTMGALLFDLGGHNKRKIINSTYCLILEQLGWGCGQLWWYESPRGAVERNICLWIWEAICYSAESHYSLYKR